MRRPLSSCVKVFSQSTRQVPDKFTYHTVELFDAAAGLFCGRHGDEPEAPGAVGLLSK